MIPDMQTIKSDTTDMAVIFRTSTNKEAASSYFSLIYIGILKQPAAYCQLLYWTMNMQKSPLALNECRDIKVERLQVIEDAATSQ